MTAEEAAPTELFAGKYRLLRMLGKGAMGEVWLAEEEGPRSFRRRVAVKRLLSTTTDIGDIATSSFVAEAQVIAKLDHANIVRLIELGNADSELYLVLDYIDGAALDRLVRKKHGGGALSPKAVAYVGREIALALEAVHSLCDDAGNNYGVVHRDVSPSNILISRDGKVRLSDFGVARISAFHGEKTETGIFKGKLPYMPPEQARGQKFDGRADIYSLGVTLFESIWGQRLRKAETQTQLIVLIATERAPFLRDVMPDVPEALAHAIDMTLELDPEQRTADGGKLAADLDAALRAYGPNAVKEAREELRARVEKVAGPPTQSSTLSGAKDIGAGSGVSKKQPWSMQISKVDRLGPDSDEGEPSSGAPSSESVDSASASSSPVATPTQVAAGVTKPPNAALKRSGSGTKRPVLELAAGDEKTVGDAKPAVFASAAGDSKRGTAITVLLAATALLVGAGLMTLLMKKSPEEGPQGGGTSASASASVSASPAPPPAASTAEAQAPASAAGATATASAGPTERPTAPEKSSLTQPVGGGAGTKPRTDPTAPASATAAVDPAQPGSLQVIVLPWGDVSVDGKLVGTTPIPAIQLPPGPHSVVVKNAELGATRSASVVVKPGAPSTVKFDLRKTE